MRRWIACFSVLVALGVALAEEKTVRCLPPVEARQAVGRDIRVEMTVQAAKDRLEKRGEIYLDSEFDFKDPKNFAVVFTKAGAGSLREAGIADAAGHLLGKLIRAAGTVQVVDDVPRIEIDDAQQIKIVEK